MGAPDRAFPRLASMALLLVASAGMRAQSPGAPPAPLVGVQVEGGDRDDQAYARAAAGLKLGATADAKALAEAVEALKATDRFSDAGISMESGASGPVARIRLVPWPQLTAWTFLDDGVADAPDARSLFPDLRKGIRVGAARREDWRQRAEQRLRASGFPLASVEVQVSEGGARLGFTIRRGAPARIRRLVFEGNAGSYGEAGLRKLLEIQPGRTLWTLSFRREALARLRKRFLKDKRFEWKADFDFNPDGTLVLKADPGPVVELRAVGASLGFGGISELAPIARAERYGPELLDEGDRRIFRHLRNKGFLDPVVEHRREVVAGTPDRPEQVRLTYVIKPGSAVVLSSLRFEGNEFVDERTLRRIADLPRGIGGFGAPKSNPDLLQGLEDRLRAHYLRLGFSEVRVRRALPVQEQGSWVQAFIIKEGPKRMLSGITLQLPGNPSFDAWAFGGDLLRLLGERPARRRKLERDQETRIFEADLEAALGLKARLERKRNADGTVLLSLVPGAPMPYVKGDLLGAVAALRGRLSTLGIQRPRENLSFEESSTGLSIRIDIPDSPALGARRLVVQGSDRTRARAILREAELDAGAPVSPEALGRSQARVANLGAFQRVDLEPLPGAPDGSLLLKLSERSPWVLTHSFGYDRSQGYHFGSGVQRLNVGGMGRSIDFGIRAGDATINSEQLRKWFPTGDFARSIDQFSLGYSDPRFTPPILKRWIPERTQYRAQVAYIVEKQTVFETRRRRVVNTLDWRLDPQRVIQIGHRFERTEVLSAVEPDPADAEEWIKAIFEAAQIPGGRIAISAPFMQFIRDTRDNAFDPTQGTFFSARLDLANQLFGTSSNSSFVKLDVRHQWNWPVGPRASWGVAALGLRLGVANPTARSAEGFPISERFFAGGPFTHRGVEPDLLGPRGNIPILDPDTKRIKVSPAGNRLFQLIPVGGQGLALVNLEYRFPLWGQSLWAEVFMDSGQVYRSLRSPDPTLSEAPFPPFRTALGFGLIIKLGLPIKIEYAADLKRILGRPRTRDERETELQGVLISAGFQF